MAIHRSVKVGAMADYLLGKPHKIIIRKWGVSDRTLRVWISEKREHFKKRYREKK